MTDGGEPESQRSKESNLKKAFSEIERVGASLNLPLEVVEFTESTYRQVLKARNEQYWDIEDTAMATLYVAAKVQGEPIKPEDIVSVDRISTNKKSLLRRSKKINNLLSLDIAAFYDSSSYIDRYCEELELDEKVQERAHEIVDICSDAGIAGGKSPSGWAAAAIYNAILDAPSKELTQEDIAEVADVTCVTIRNRYQEQREVIKKSGKEEN